MKRSTDVQRSSFRIVIIVLLLFLGSSSVASADHWHFRDDDGDRNERWETIRVAQLISDDRHGKWHELRQRISDRPVDHIEVVLRRENGTRDTFCNLGFEHGRVFAPARMQIDRNELHTLTWSADGESAGGRDLVMKAYNGEVFVESLRIFYRGRHSDFRDGDRWSSDERRRLEDLASELDDRADHATHEVREHGPRGRILESAETFVSDTKRFRRLVSEESSPWELDRAARRLTDDATDIRDHIDRGSDDRHLEKDWNKVLDTLQAIAAVTRRFRR